MTKSWDDVRDLIYKLYLLEGRSLTETSGIIERERDFQASPRAYRMKLKEWGIKRSSVLSTPNENESSLDDLPMTEETYEETSVFEPRAASSSQGQRRISNGPHTDDTYADIYDEIKTIRMAHQAFALIHNLSFEAGTDTFLHYIARQNEDILSGGIQAVLTCMREMEHGIDIRNSRGQSALEVAIRSDIVDNVSVLLAAGASVKQRNRRGEQPFHIALKSDITHRMEICVLLLANGADPTSPIRMRKRSQSEIRETNIWDQFQESGGGINLQEWQTDPEVLAYCHLQHQGGYGNGTRFNTATPVAFRHLVNTCCRLPPRHPTLDYLYVNCTKFFLKMGSTPFVSKAAGLDCPAGTCGTLASYSFFHCRDHAYVDVLVSSSLTKYSSSLAELLLRPCAHRVRQIKGKPLSAILSDLLQRTKQSPIPQSFLPTLLQGCPNDEPEKPAMLKVLLETNTIDVHHRDPDGLLPVQHLLNIPTPLRYKMAEVLLSTQLTLTPTPTHSPDPTHTLFHPHWPLQPLSTRLGQLYAYIKGCERWRYDDATAAAWHDGGFELCGCSPPAGMVWSRRDLSHGQLLELHRCVLHVCTRVVVRGGGGATSVARLCDALRLRDGLGLPPVEMENRVLLELLSRDGRGA